MPIVAAAQEYRAKVEGEGVRFQRMRPDISTLGLRLGMSEREIARTAAKRPDFIVRELVLPHLRESYEDVLTVVRDADMTVTHSIAYGAQLAAERCNVPRISVVLQPMIFFSVYDPPIIATVPRLSRWIYGRGRTWTRAAFALSKRLARDWVKPIELFRREIGLPESDKNPLFAGQFSPLGTLALYSPLFGPLQPDHPPNTEIAGFAFYDGDSAMRDESLQCFLANGEPPIVFTQGTSAVHDADVFIRESLAAVKSIGCRAVFVLDDQRAREWRAWATPSILITGYAAYSDLFPQARIIVHHGGMGTTAQALRAGRPQLIVPYLVDQPDNAARVERLGCGRAVEQARYERTRVAKEIRTLIEDANYARKAREVAAVISMERGADRAADFIVERLAKAHDAKEPGQVNEAER